MVEMEKKGVVGASAPQWISVNDRLPDEYQRVLVFSVDHGIKIDFRDPSWYKFGDDWSRYNGVTHWMPMPKPPKEGSAW